MKYAAGSILAKKIEICVRSGAIVFMAAIVASVLSMAALAQGAAQVSFSVPSGRLTSALAVYGQQASLQIAYLDSIAVGKTSAGFSGPATPEVALSHILADTGLSYRFTNASTVTILDPRAASNLPSEEDGSLVLDVIDVTARTSGNPVHAPFETAAPTSHISADSIEHFRGSSPADIFRGTPGVMSGEARNGAGAIDVNIRGMQGMGRVAVTVDGAENSLTVYQGYQGLSNRTYVDPDLLAGVDIVKGSDVTSSGIAGTVAMRTLDASDIVREGNTFGLRIKGGFGTNTASPEAGSRAGYSITNPIGAVNDPSTGYGSAVASPTGMDRPSFFTPTQSSTSIVGAASLEKFDFLAGYAYRERGNYYAGTNGPHANPVSTGPRPFCYSSGVCPDVLTYRDYIENHGLANYRAGEEVLNTELETKSWLIKATARVGEAHSLQLGYTGYRSEAGDLLASALTSNTSQAVQQKQTTGTELDTGTLRYRWNPEDNALVDLKADLFITRLELRNPPRNAYGTSPESLGLPADFRTGSDTTMWGATLSNKSSWAAGGRPLDVSYGASYRQEDTRPSDYTDIIEGWLNLRDAKREEAAVFASAGYKPLDWLTLNSGLRYTHFWSDDRRTTANSPLQLNSMPKRDDGGFSPFAGVTVGVFDGVDLYVNYSSALRFPSLFESVSAFTIIPNPDLGPERANNWETGVNIRESGLLTAGDTAMLKFGYFNWNVSDYIARSYRAFQSGSGSTWYGMQVYNIDRAKFEGLELSTRYEKGGFSADFGANYYLNMAFCQKTGGCEDKTLYGDYATNHIPPKFTLSLTLSQKLFEDRLTLGGRVTQTGARAIEHGQVTGQGLSQFITQVNWRPYALADLFADLRITENLVAGVRVENVTDQYYVDPLSLVQIPGPGRSFYASVTVEF